MITKTFALTLDTKKGVIESPVVVVKGDNGNVFQLRLQDGGTDLDLSAAYVCVAFRGAGGSYTEDDEQGVTIDGAVVTVPVLANAVSEGTNSCDVQIYTGDTLVTTCAFTFECRAATVGEDTVAADPGLPIVLRMIEMIRSVADEFPTITVSSIPGGHRITVTNYEGVPVTCDIMDGRNGKDGTSGVYVGSGTMPEGYNVQIDPTEDTPAGNTSANANLLDNPWFTVNQRETSTYTAGKYGVDRWKLVSGSATVSGSSITLNGTLRQIRENALGTNDFTASVKCTSGTATATYDDSTRYFDIVSSGGVIKAAKLELGSSSTLQYDAEPDYATELLKCQRYFLRIKKVGTNFQGTAMSFNNNTVLHWFIPAAVPMRVNPDATFSVNPVFLLRAAGSAKTPTSATFDYARCTGDGINMQFKDMTDVTLSTFTVYGVYLKGDIYLSADL